MFFCRGTAPVFPKKKTTCFFFFILFEFFDTFIREPFIVKTKLHKVIVTQTH